MNDAALRNIDGELETLPPRWAWAKPLEIGEASLGKMLDRAKHTRGSAMPYLRNLNVRWGGFDLSDLFTMYFRDDELERYSVQQGDLLICEGGEPGRCAVWHRTDVHVKYQKALHRLRLHEGIEPHFVMYHLMHDAWQGNLERFFTGSTIKHFTGESLQRLRLKIAPADEQQRIVAKIDELFSELDAGLASLKRARALLKKYRQAVLKAAVTGELTRDWRERHKGEIKESGAELLQRILKARRAAWEAAEQKKLRTKGKPLQNDRWKQNYKEPHPPDTSGLPELPEGWVWARVEQLGMVTGGLTKNPKRSALPLKAPYLRVANVYANELRLEDIEEIGVTSGELERVLLEPRDLLVVEGNGSIEQIGRVAIWDGSIDRCAHQNHLIKVRLIESKLARFAVCWLLSSSGRRMVEQVASSTSGLHTLNISKVEALIVPVPPLSELEQALDGVQAALSNFENAEAAVSVEMRRGDALRQSILKAAFAGKLVPQDPNDEPASVLLERIRAERAASPRLAHGRRRAPEADAPRERPA